MTAKRNTISMIAIRHAISLNRGGHGPSTDSGLADLWTQLSPQTQLAYLQSVATEVNAAIAAYEAEIAAEPEIVGAEGTSGSTTPAAAASATAGATVAGTAASGPASGPAASSGAAGGGTAA